jgi:hypothetical protein
MAVPEEQSKKEVAAAEARFQRAMLDADVKTLEAVLDATFMWTTSNSEKLTKQQLIDAFKSAKLKFMTLKTSSVAISVYGETAVVRGEALRQRSSTPSKPGVADPAASSVSYTMTFVNIGGQWKAVALHSSVLEK